MERSQGSQEPDDAAQANAGAVKADGFQVLVELRLGYSSPVEIADNQGKRLVYRCSTN